MAAGGLVVHGFKFAPRCCHGYSKASGAVPADVAWHSLLFSCAPSNKPLLCKPYCSILVQQHSLRVVTDNYSGWSRCVSCLDDALLMGLPESALAFMLVALPNVG